jgi:hypothetical protein
VHHGKKRTHDQIFQNEVTYGLSSGKQPESWHDLRQARSAFSGIDDDPWAMSVSIEDSD